MEKPQKSEQAPSPLEITEMRQAAGLSTADAAASVGVVSRAWQRWESGSRNMHVSDWQLFLIKMRQRLVAQSILSNGVNDPASLMSFCTSNPFAGPDAVFRHIGLDGLIRFDHGKIISLQVVEAIGHGPAIAYTMPDPPMPLRLGIAFIARRVDALEGETDTGVPIVRMVNQNVTIDTLWQNSSFLRCLMTVLRGSLARAGKESGHFFVRLVTEHGTDVISADYKFDTDLNDYHIYLALKSDAA